MNYRLTTPHLHDNGDGTAALCITFEADAPDIAGCEQAQVRTDKRLTPLSLTGSQQQALRIAITAALGDGAIVVDKGRLRAALADSWGCDCETCRDGLDQAVRNVFGALTAPEVEG